MGCLRILLPGHCAAYGVHGVRVRACSGVVKPLFRILYAKVHTNT